MTTGVTSRLPLRLAEAATAAAAAAATQPARRPPSASISTSVSTSVAAPVAPTRSALAAGSTARSAARLAASRFASVTMLGRANKNYEARNPASASASGAASAAKISSPAADLTKTLFPSSSPRESASIADFCKRPLSATSQASTFRFGAVRPRPSEKPLQARSPNTNSTVRAATSSSSSRSAALASGVVSLCSSKTDSFTDAPPSALRPADENELAAFGFSLQDFTDDENLDLDLEDHMPSALPPQPAAATAPGGPAGPTASSAHADLVPVASWPSSSPSTHAASAKAAPKRSSSDGSGLLDSPVPVAKKRTMPKHWSRRAEDDAAAARAPGAATPAPSKLAAAAASIWDPTASAVKAQKKQLKDQAKRHGSAAAADGEGDSRAAALVEKAAALPKPSGPLTLSDEQQHVRNLVCLKKASVFFTGPAGTGKSVLMRAIIDDLRKRYAKEPEQLGVTASTGLAACNIGGMTLHSFAGIGLGKEDTDTLVRKIRQNQKARNRWLKTKTLVIDEVSMVDGDLFDKLSQIGRIIRKNGRPWGGIQLVLTGDFFQLPPVPERDKRDVKFAFEANTWAASIDHTIGLTEVFRQKDPEFAHMLNEMRLGRISDQTVHTFKSLSRNLHFDDGLEVTELFPTRFEVENSNERRLKSLPGKSYFYEALDTGEPQLRDKLLQNMMAPKKLELRVNAQVMLIKNMDETLVNGSLGTIKKFMTESEYTMSEFDDLMAIDPDTKKRTLLLNSYLNSHDGDAGRAAGAGGGGRVYPYVEFRAIGGATRGILVRPEEWKVELPNGQVQASRSQLPLILAWALSIHKAQGQTLERVKVDLGRVFEKGQAYVALSRATTKTGLQVLRFEKHKVMAHPKVIDFYSKLSSAAAALKGRGGDGSILAFTSRSSVNIDQKPPPHTGPKKAKAAFSSG